MKVRKKQQINPRDKYDLSKREDQIKYEQEMCEILAYSQGDDDVLVMELAFEKYRKSKGFELDWDKCYFRDGGATIRDEGDVVRLIVGSNEKGYTCARVGLTNPVLMDKTLSEIKNKLDDYVLEIAFEEGNKLNLTANHSIEIVGFETDSNGKPLIVLVDPNNSSKRIKMNYYDVLLSAKSLFVWENPKKRTNLCSRMSWATSTQEERDNLQALQKKYQDKPRPTVTTKNGQGWH